MSCNHSDARVSHETGGPVPAIRYPSRNGNRHRLHDLWRLRVDLDRQCERTVITEGVERWGNEGGNRNGVIAQGIEVVEIVFPAFISVSGLLVKRYENVQRGSSPHREICICVR